MQATLTEFVRGRYHESENVLGEECFGHWMVDEYDQLKA
jgi:hypothetical protein